MGFLYRNALMFTLLAALSALGSAFTAQYVFDLWPCVLCLYQRWPYAAVILIALIGLIVGKNIGPGYFLLLCAVGFATTAAIGGFHVGVEQGWWVGTAECVGDTSKAMSVQELKAQIMSAPVVRCDDIAWSLFGISMAGYNLIAASIFSAFSLIAGVKSLRTS